MAFISRANALFFYCVGVFFMILTYFVMEPVLHKSQAAPAGFLGALAANIKIFYALGVFFMVFGIFMFVISPFYAEKRHECF